MKDFSLTGRWVRIESLALSHLPDLEHDFDPGLFDFYPKPYASAREFVEENLDMQKRGNYRPFAIVLITSGEAIGCSEFSSIDLRNRKLEIGGSWLRPEFHQTGANSEAKLLLLRHAFEDLKCVRVQFTTHALNRRSRAALEKIGAKFEGILRNAMILPDGSLRDDASYSIISHEWPATREALEQRVRKKPKPCHRA